MIFTIKRPSGTVICMAGIVMLLSSFAAAVSNHKKNGYAAIANSSPAAKDSMASQRAFLQAYKVLMSPRCMNCHPAGDIPLQGEDSRLHTQGVKRGIDGQGLYALKCANCHQPGNTAGEHMPPGNPNWHLPPANMKMVFEGRTPRQLAAQLKDPAQNGHKTLVELIDHVTNDKLVLGGWDPGEGRAMPPLTHAAFAQYFKEWIDKGAVLPVQ
jgi:mono/diheme cytochrome c family protein